MRWLVIRFSLSSALLSIFVSSFLYSLSPKEDFKADYFNQKFGLKKENAISGRAKAILRIIIENSLDTNIDALSVASETEKMNFSVSQSLEGIDTLAKRIEECVRQNKPIVFTCTGYPFKSSNETKKVISALPDMAEYHSFEFFDRLLEKIEKIHPKGAKLILYVDGLSLAPVLGIPYDRVEIYEAALKQLAKNKERIQILSMKDLLPGKTIADIEKSLNDLEDKNMSIDPDAERILNKRLELEFSHLEGRKIIKKINNAKRSIAARLMMRMDASRRLIDRHRPEGSLILSFHYSRDLSKKIGIMLSKESFFTPWHAVALLKRDPKTGGLKKNYTYVLKDEIKHEINSEYELKYIMVNGIPCFYYEEK